MLKSTRPDLTPNQAQARAVKYIEIINNGLKQLFPELGDESTPWVGARSNLAKLGKRVWEIGRKLNGGTYPQSDHTMLDYSLDFADDVGSKVLRAALILPAFQLRWIWAGRWYDQGMPRVVWEHAGFPEMLMASSAHPSTIDLACPPWRAFLIDLPPKLLKTNSALAKELVDLQQVLALYTEVPNTEERVWAYLAEGPDSDGVSVELWRHGLATEKLLETGTAYENPLYAEYLEKRDDRLFILIGRLLIGLCLTLSNPEKIREAKHTKGKRGITASAKKKRRTKPVTRNYVVGAPTRLKVREALAEFVDRGKVRRSSDSPGVKTLIRGHWKMQPHGPKQSLRKLIHREPYWSPRDEDNDMPVVVRDRVVVD